MVSNEKLWGKILSRDFSQIQSVYKSLDKNDQKAILKHLLKMVTESGWHPEQKKSAQKALEVIKALKE
jgi:hypothetical protein